MGFSVLHICVSVLKEVDSTRLIAYMSCDHATQMIMLSKVDRLHRQHRQVYLELSI